jgi:hypothetical protein
VRHGRFHLDFSHAGLSLRHEHAADNEGHVALPESAFVSMSLLEVMSRGLEGILSFPWGARFPKGGISPPKAEAE